MATESVTSRYNREWLQLEDDRKIRGYDHRSTERRSRDFVDPATITVDGDGTVHGTVGTTGDNDNGFTVTIDPA